MFSKGNASIRSVNLITWLLALMMLLAGCFYMLNTGESGRSMPFNVATLVGASVVVFGACILSFKRMSVTYGKMFTPILCIVMVLLLPLLYFKSDIIAFLPRILMIAFALLFFFATYQYKLKTNEILFVILLATLLQAVWGAIQSPLGANQVFGIFQQKNVLGSFLATGFAISIWLATFERKSNIIRCVACMSSLLLVFVIYSTASRTGFLGATIVFVLFLPALINNIKTKSVQVWLSVFILSSAVVFGRGYFNTIFDSSAQSAEVQHQEQISPPVLNRGLFEKSGREHIYPQVIKLAADNFWTGVGFERFMYEYAHKTALWYKNGDFDFYGNHNLSHPHSELLYWFVEGGVLSLSAMLFFIGYLVYCIKKVSLGKRLAMMALLVPIALHILLEYPIYHSYVHLFVLIVLIRLIDENRVDSDNNLIGLSKVGGFSFVGVGVVSVLVTTTMLASVVYANAKLIDYVENKKTNPEELIFLKENPVLGYNYNHIYREKYIVNAINSKSESRVRQYVKWIEVENLSTPRVSNYRYLLFAYLALGEKEKAAKVQKEADFLYPKFGFAKRNFRVPLVEKGT